MSQEIYTKEEHYHDWKSENLEYLKEEFIEESKYSDFFKDEYIEEKADDFEAYCRQEFKDRD